jgi:hypothetical protein
LEPVLLATATAALWIVSRGKWSDALIDSGREWIVPDALSRGALLYRDVVYWFGPFTPYFQAGFFHLFGSSFSSLVAAGVVTSLCLLALLFAALCRVTGRREALLWSALAVPALLFMPHAGGSLLGMGYRIWQAAAFALGAALLASHRRLSRHVRGAGLAGILAGVSGLCRTEWGVAGVAAVLLALALGERSNRVGFARRAGAAILGYVVVFGGGLSVFLLTAGPAAVLDDGHVLFGRLPEETRAFLVAFSGIRDWKRGLVQLVYSTAMWAGAFLLIETLASGQRGRRRIGVLAGVLVVLAAAALAGGASGAVIWSAAPAVSAAALAAGCLRRPSPRSAALAAFGLLGLVLSYRRPFHIGDSAYTGPPLLFAFVSAAGLLRLRVAQFRQPRVRRRVRMAFAAAVWLAVGVSFAARLRHYARWEGEPIPGTGGQLTARAEVSREILGVARTVRQRTAATDGLVVFPEGELINFLSGRRNPIRHQLYLPGYLNDANEGEVLRELERARPAAVVIWLRPTSEYDRGLFGVDYGRRIREWIGREYDLEPYRAPGAPRRTNPRFLLAVRRGGA